MLLNFFLKPLLFIYILPKYVYIETLNYIGMHFRYLVYQRYFCLNNNFQIDKFTPFVYTYYIIQDWRSIIPEIIID